MKTINNIEDWKKRAIESSLKQKPAMSNLRFIAGSMGLEFDKCGDPESGCFYVVCGNWFKKSIFEVKTKKQAMEALKNIYYEKDEKNE